jgi:hypothetical protein
VASSHDYGISQIELISRRRDPTIYLNFFTGSKEVFSLIKLAVSAAGGWADF